MQLPLGQLNEGTEVLMVLSIILLAGFIMTRLTSTLNLPKVSSYILAGALTGLCCPDFTPMSIIMHMGSVSDLALAFTVFGMGEFFKHEVLLRTGKRTLVIIFLEALSAGAMMTLFLRFIFSLGWDFALVFGAIVVATAPASTMVTISQYKTKGESVDMLFQIVALDDAVYLLAFSVISAIAGSRAPNGVGMEDIIVPLVLNPPVILLGFFCGYFLSCLLVPSRSRDNRLILATTMLLGISEICAAVSISPLPSCIVFGAAYINLTKDRKLFRRINDPTLPVMSILSIVSGMNLGMYMLLTAGIIGFSYFIVRIIGRYTGIYASCLITNTSMEVRNPMGLVLIPQTGVAIDLAFPGQRLFPPEIGSLMLTIILLPSALYEMIGPINAKLILIFSRSIPSGKLLETLPQRGEADENFGTVTVFSLIPVSELSQRDGESLAQIVKELDVGVDERDDDDTESAVSLEEQKERKKRLKKGHKRKGEKIMGMPSEENVWAEGYEQTGDYNLKQRKNA